MDQHTVRASGTHLPPGFLLGVGLDAAEVQSALRGAPAYPSTFISHADADGSFVTKLYEDLRRHGVMCWHFRHDMKGGEPWQDQIDSAIRRHDKLVLVCSRQATYRPNVVREILLALKVEREMGIKKLVPVRLDDHILSDLFMEEAREKVRSGEWPENWVFNVRRQYIIDFTGWRDAGGYRESLSLLLESLRLSPG
jgi:hypothetical protein